MPVHGIHVTLYTVNTAHVYVCNVQRQVSSSKADIHVHLSPASSMSQKTWVTHGLGYLTMLTSPPTTSGVYAIPSFNNNPDKTHFETVIDCRDPITSTLAHRYTLRRQT